MSVSLRVACRVRDANTVAAALTSRGWGTLWIDEPLVQSTDDEGYVLGVPDPDAPATVHAWPTREGETPEVMTTVAGHEVAITEDGNGETDAVTDWSTAWRSAHATWVPLWEGCGIVPPWAEVPDGCEALVIEPGGAFGTGAHATTRHVLARLRDVLARRPGASVLDLGCGSGVLTVAAVRWGAGRVVAVDCDAVAVHDVARNLAHNGIEATRVTVHEGDVLGDAVRAAGLSDVVLCNVGVAEGARVIAAQRDVLAPGGTLVVSGIYRASCTRIEAAARSAELTIAGCDGDEEWCTYALVSRMR